MNAELRSISTPESTPLAEAKPSSDEFCIPVMALIGAQGGPGFSDFYFEVCSPQWIASQIDEHPFLWSTHRLVVARFEPSEIEMQVRKRLQHCSGACWDEVKQKIQEWARSAE